MTRNFAAFVSGMRERVSYAVGLSKKETRRSTTKPRRRSDVSSANQKAAKEASQRAQQVRQHTANMRAGEVHEKLE